MLSEKAKKKKIVSFKKISLILAGFMMVGVCIEGFGLVRTYLFRSNASVYQAKILKSHVKTNRHGGTDKTYTPIVEYSFIKDGLRYKSDSIDMSLFSSFSNRSGAKDVTSQFRTGRAYDVYVDNEDPYKSYLLVEYSKNILWIPLIYLAILSFVYPQVQKHNRKWQ